MARQTWSFFDTFVTAEQNMLPPDNFQEIPNAVVANRTSPTNIGLYLLSIVAAREFGWIGTCDAMERLEATFSTLGKLERFRGHLYNWYDTHDLRPLDPKYVSTVDSGNLAGHLLTLEGACRAVAGRHPRIGPSTSAGSLDTARTDAGRSPRPSDDDRRNYGVSPRQLDSALAALRFARVERPDNPLAAVAESSAGRPIGDLAQALTDERARGQQCAAARVVRHAARQCAEPPARLPQPDAAAARARRASGGTRAAGARALRMAMEFGFLIEPERQLLSIGYRVAERAQDPSCYDLLASEARLASFFAIAKGDLPVRHWFRLGRLLTPVGQGLRSLSLVRFDVRVSDARARHARAGGQRARGDIAPDRRAANSIRRRAQTPVGCIRIGVQRARSRIYLSIFELRSTRPRIYKRFG